MSLYNSFMQGGKIENSRIWTSIWTKFIKLPQLVLWYPFWIFWRSCDSIDNDENKIDDDWEALEEEDCKFCDEKKRTGWNSSKHIEGSHLIWTFQTRWCSYYFFLVFYIVIYFSNLAFSFELPLECEHGLIVRN